ncbi:unnamed protein product [Caenorhabditis angaria]|uniref:Uncharacterized protein n=1 Tax=Caenorhabditis angaria TaxID=860376 RepID=A0A9P1N3Z7_9PELO|nr:unnamed protein product [Caenorhabditis angaria]
MTIISENEPCDLILPSNMPTEVIRELDGEKLLDRTTFFTEFSTTAYLEDFYNNVEDPAMQMVLTFLPNIVARVGKIQKILDFGAGPTIHVAACYRETAEEIYLADYLPQNRQELEKWLAGNSNFDWSHPINMILTREGRTLDKKEQVLTETRGKIRGVFHCDCFQNPSTECSQELQGQFDVVVTIFCVEYCSNTLDEYYKAIKNIAQNVKSGGYLVYGGILEENWCSFGGRKFTCLYITKEIMLDALAKAGLFIEKDRTCVFYEINGMFMVFRVKSIIESIKRVKIHRKN